MKKFCSLFAFITVFSAVQGQSVLSVAAGTDLQIASGTVFSAGGLSLTPSAPFTVSGNELQIQPAVAHFTANNYVSRVYRFSTNTAPFSGTVGFSYADGELNGLPKANLQVNIHNGSVWSPVATAANDAVNNVTWTTTIGNKILNELALANVSAALPLRWGLITASRKAQQVTVRWETEQASGINYFTVESSTDGRTWTTLADNIPARNSSGKEIYEVTGNTYPSDRLYCRVKQTGVDGRQGYSAIAVINSPEANGGLLVYPNPVHQEVYLSTSLSGAVSSVHVYSNTGILVKSWYKVQSSYTIQELAAGTYHFQVRFNDGSSRQYKISKF